MKKSQTKIDKLSPEQLKAIAPLHAAAAVVAPKAEKTALSDDKNRKKLTPEQTEEELKALEQAEAEQVAEVAGEPIELAQAAEAVATDAAAGGVVAAETTSGLVGSAAVAGGVGTGAVAGGALVGAAALNNGGGDGSAAAPRELTAFNVQNKNGGFSEQNVIADVVNIEATGSVSVFGIIAADFVQSGETTLENTGTSFTQSATAVAAQSVTILAAGGSTPAVVALPNPEIAIESLAVVNAEAFVGGDIQVARIVADTVELTSENGSVYFQSISGSSEATRTSKQFNNETSSGSQSINVEASSSVVITADNDVGSDRFDFRAKFIVGDGLNLEGIRGIAAQSLEITASSIYGFEVAGELAGSGSGGSSVKLNANGDQISRTNTETSEESFGAAAKVVFNASSVSNMDISADDVTIKSNNVFDLSVNGGSESKYSYSNTTSDNAAEAMQSSKTSNTVFAADSLVITAVASEMPVGADIKSIQIISAVNVDVTARNVSNILIDGGSSSLDSFDGQGDSNRNNFSFDSSFDNSLDTYSDVTMASETVNIKLENEGSNINVSAVDFTLTAGDVYGVQVDGGRNFTGSDSASYDYATNTDTFASKDTTEITGADFVSITVNQGSENLEEGVIAINSIVAKELELTANSIYTYRGGFGSEVKEIRYTIIGGFSTEGSLTEMYVRDVLIEEELSDKLISSESTYSEAVTAAESVTINVTGFVSGLNIAAESLEATAGNFSNLRVDGGYEYDDATENLSFLASAFVDIEATGTTSPSYIDVLALEGTITTAGASGGTGSTGDYVTVRNAEGQLQEITIVLGQSGNDFLDFEGYDYSEIDFEASDVGETGVLTIVFTDGNTTDTFTVSNVESFSFDNGVTASYDLLASFINNANMPQVG